MAQPYDKKFLEDLAKKVLGGTATDAEKLFLLEYYKSFGKEPDIADSLTGPEIHALKEEIRTSLLRRIGEPSPRVIPFYRRGSFRRISAAAAVAAFFVVLGTVYFLKNNNNKPLVSPPLAHDFIKDPPAGSNKATLTLGNGRLIILTDAKNGTLAAENVAVIRKTADGEIVYKGEERGAHASAAIVYNTMSTPRGGQYHLVLSDGTGVWLNAASSITYPVTFSGDRRSVEVTGEAYFEVAPDKASPFLVTSRGQTVQVLGTRFNISAYADEPGIRTTLLEGSVRVNVTGNRDLSAVLRPGQQSRIDNASSGIQVKLVDVNEAIAWHKDLFVFNDEDLKSILRKVSRWYDVDVVYDGGIPDIKLYGVVSRAKPVSAVLHALEATSRASFTLEKGKIVVIPKF